MTLYVVSIPRQDEEGPYNEDHYFKNLYNATMYAVENGAEILNTVKLNKILADQLAEDETDRRV